MSRIEIPLAQGWARGLQCVFEDEASSAALDRSRFFHVEQVHGREIHCLSRADIAQGPRLLGKADGLWVAGDDLQGYGLLVKSADCGPLLYVDHENHSLAAVHAGWRGLVQGIHLAPFRRGLMNPQSTWIWLGPSLNGKSFEVGSDMWEQFPRERQKDERLFEPGASPERRFFYPWRFLEDDFRQAKVELFYNVEVDTGQDLSFASHRRARRQGLERVRQSNYSWISFSAS